MRVIEYLPAMRTTLDAIKALILINVLLFGITYFIPGMEHKMRQTLALYFPEHKYFGYWQFVTSMFMHGGFMHILLNMYALWAFGTPLEHQWGKGKFLFFYFMSGIGAGLIYTLVNYFQFNTIYNELIAGGATTEAIDKLLDTAQYDPSVITLSNDRLLEFLTLYNTPAVGASGAIYGVLVAFALLYPNAKLALLFFPVPIAAKYFIPVLLLLDLFSGVTGFSIFGGGIAHFAHIGGAIIGFLLMWYWRRK